MKWKRSARRGVMSASIVDAAVVEVNALLTLPSGWDGEGAAEVSLAAAQAAVDVIVEVTDDGSPVPEVYAGTDGGLSVEWDTEGGRLIVEVSTDGDVGVLLLCDDVVVLAGGRDVLGEAASYVI